MGTCFFCLGRWKIYWAKFGLLVKNPKILEKIKRSKIIEEMTSPSIFFHSKNWIHNTLRRRLMQSPTHPQRGEDLKVKPRAVHHLMEAFFTTMFLHFFLFLIATCASNVIPAVHSKCIEAQQQSLLHFKKSLVFDSSSSSKLITWNSSTECCSWLGVTCSTNGHVVGLDISSESISCNIDNSSSLFQLQHLQSLNLAYNDFNGSQIPSAIGKPTNLSHTTMMSFNVPTK